MADSTVADQPVITEHKRGIVAHFIVQFSVLTEKWNSSSYRAAVFDIVCVPGNLAHCLLTSIVCELENALLLRNDA